MHAEWVRYEYGYMTYGEFKAIVLEWRRRGWLTASEVREWIKRAQIQARRTTLNPAGD